MRVIPPLYQYAAFRSIYQRSLACTSMSKEGFFLKETFATLRADPSRIFLLDGGTGEELFRKGVPDDRKIWSATALVHPQHHSVLENVHLSFLRSGSKAITTNSYGVVPGVGFEEEEITKLLEESGRIARRAAEKHTLETSSAAFVLGSLGPLVESYRPDRIMPYEKGVTCYERACEALSPYVDAFLAETMSCIDESSQVIEAVARSNSQRSSLLISYTLDPNGNFRDGEDLLEGLQRTLDNIKSYKDRVEEAITKALERIHSDLELSRVLNEDGILLGAYAHLLTQIDPNWTLAESEAAQPLRNDLSEQVYWDSFVKRWISIFGVQLVGGCCGITPEHISYINKHITDR